MSSPHAPDRASGAEVVEAPPPSRASGTERTQLQPSRPEHTPHHIGNGGMRPPTPTPGFLGEQCATFVDRSVGETFEFSIVIASEDREGLEGELGDDHTFQFFAYCQQPQPRDVLPPWIDVDDVARATLAGLVPAPPEENEVLASSPWAQVPGHDGELGGCVVPITAKDDRLPISCEATATPAVWTMDDVPTGPYWVHGYTYDPPVNTWTPRVGVVVVHDGDPSATPPWVALTAPVHGATVSPNVAYELRGCAGGSGASRVVVELARTNADDLGDPAVWSVVGEADVTASSDFAITLDPTVLGDDAWNRAYVVRARVVDAEDTTVTTGHAWGTLSLRSSAAVTDSSDLRPPPDWCGLGLDDTEDTPVDGDGCRAAGGSRRGAGASLVALCLGLGFGLGALRSRVRRRGSRSR